MPERVRDKVEEKTVLSDQDRYTFNLIISINRNVCMGPRGPWGSRFRVWGLGKLGLPKC